MRGGCRPDRWSSAPDRSGSGLESVCCRSAIPASGAPAHEQWRLLAYTGGAPIRPIDAASRVGGAELSPSVCLSVLENSGSLSGGPVRSLESRHPGLRFSSCCVTRTSGTALVWRRIDAPLGPPRSLPCHVHGRRNTCGPAGAVEDTRERNGDRPAWLLLQLRKMIRWKKGEHIGFQWCKKEQ